jgi:enamine deaminase RidA (YjgF/YER057c/UK114 family)
MFIRRFSSCLLLCLMLLSAGALMPALAQSNDTVQRVPIPNSDFPISAAVIVPPDYDTIYVSGNIAAVADSRAPKGSVERYGDTKTQTISVLQQIEKTLKEQNVSMGDVVMMHVYLAGDPKKDGKMDFAGMMEGYKQFFGTTEQPGKPARSAMQVAALAAPGALVEIEVIAVRKRGPHARPVAAALEESHNAQ